jgi:hypothetical protein
LTVGTVDRETESKTLVDMSEIRKIVGFTPRPRSERRLRPMRRRLSDHVDRLGSRSVAVDRGHDRASAGGATTAKSGLALIAAEECYLAGISSRTGSAKRSEAKVAVLEGSGYQ